jgi:hypothetical protein
LAALALTACAGGDIHRPYTYTFIKSGGFAGVRDELVVDSAAKRLTFKSRDGAPKTAEATETDLKALEDTLKTADFMKLEGPYPCGSCADQFLYDATLAMEGSKGHTVHWEDGSNAPAELTALGAWSAKLIHDKFPPPTPVPVRSPPAAWPAAATQ